MKPQQPKAAPTNTIDNSLDEILHQLKVSISLSSKAPYPVFDDSIVGHAFDEAKDAINKTIMEDTLLMIKELIDNSEAGSAEHECQQEGYEYGLDDLAELVIKKYGRADNE